MPTALSPGRRRARMATCFALIVAIPAAAIVWTISRRGCRGPAHGRAELPTEGASLPGSIPGVLWSDHGSFRQMDYPALMITNTALLRNPNYHQPTDTPESIDFCALGRIRRVLLDAVLELLDGQCGNCQPLPETMIWFPR